MSKITRVLEEDDIDTDSDTPKIVTHLETDLCYSEPENSDFEKPEISLLTELEEDDLNMEYLNDIYDIFQDMKDYVNKTSLPICQNLSFEDILELTESE